MVWEKLTDTWFVCEYGCFNHEFNLNEERCNHSSDSPDNDGRMNAAHWKRTHPDPNGLPHGFLCNYHYEELVLGIKHPTDDEIEVTLEASLPTAEEFELGIGEVK